MNKYLLIGGAGFIGSHLASVLTARGDKVIICDPNAASCTTDSYRGALIKDCVLYEQPYHMVRDTIWKENPDYVIHLAALPIESEFDSPTSLMQLESDITTTYKLVVDYKKYGKGKRLLFMSSVFAYGDFNFAITEESPLNPKTTYGISKAAGEFLIKSQLEDWNIVRTTSVYGFGDTNKRATNIFVDKALNKEKMWVNANVWLDFIYIRDLVDGILVILDKAAPKEIFHVSGGEALTLPHFIYELKRHFPDIDYEEKTVTDRPNRGTMTNDKMRILLGWRPNYYLARGVDDYITLVKQYGHG